MLRAVTRQQVLQIIEDSFFGAQNFDVQFYSAGPTIVAVHFLPEGQFHFAIGRPDSDGDYKVIEAPGQKFTTPQSYFECDFDKVLVMLKDWTVRVREEVVSSNPFARELSAFRAQVESRLTEIGDDLGTFFTNAEAGELQARLDDFAARIDELVARNSELEVAVAGLRSTVLDLKESLQVVDKGTWYRMSAGRMLSGLKAIVTSKEARTLALEAARKFLLEGPK